MSSSQAPIARGITSARARASSQSEDRYLIRTNLSAAKLDGNAPVRPTKAWLHVERAFRSTKTVDFNLQELRVGNEVVPLTLMEANVLRYLIQHEGQPVPRKKLLEDVWGLHEDTDTRAIDNFMVRLRRYIEEEPSRPRHMLTVRGVGYRFVANPK